MMLKVVPPDRIQRWWQTESGIEYAGRFVVMGGALFGAVSAALRSNPPDWVTCTVLSAVFLLTFLLDGRKYRIRRKREPSESDINALDAVVETIRSSVLALAGDAHRDADLRMCVFVLGSLGGDTVFQLTNYIGPEPRYGKGRKLSSRSGAVGEAIRDGSAKFMWPMHNMTTLDFLVSKGFHRDEAAKMDLSRRSWAAIPIGNGPGNLLAVLYADAKTQSFWGNRNDNKRKVMLAAALAIAKHI